MKEMFANTQGNNFIFPTAYTMVMGICLGGKCHQWQGADRQDNCQQERYQANNCFFHDDSALIPSC